MNRHALRVLEFETVRTAVRDRCLTEEGAEQLRKTRILTDPDEISRLKKLVVTLQQGIGTTVRIPVLSFPPVGAALARIPKQGVVLDATELANIGQYCLSTEAFHGYLTSAVSESETDSSDAQQLIGSIPDVGAIGRHLARFLDPDGTVREKDIPELRSIRSRILSAQQDLSRTAKSLIGQDELRRYWNASVPTQREGRTVLPLKADHRGKVKGIVHETSGSGATVFIEPEELVTRNNAVVQAENEYRAEILRILKELSAYCRSHSETLASCIKAVIAVDLVYARARYAYDFNCVAAGTGSGELSLLSARHPLLGESAVPITLSVPPSKRVLIITGPNTGGKTVSLKTVGLLSLMNQFGLPVPAAPGTELPVFNSVFADIGDEQSIEQSLSTFSGHMRNIARILNHADENSLVLLDEVGSGTDPEEGGALAMAILDELLDRRPYTVVTTHHGRLKHYGFTQDAAANASVEFDPKNLRPTYHVIPGVPGSSHAIEVAAHMGLLRRVTRKAREYLSGEEYDTGRIIRRLTDREQEIHLERSRVRSLEGAVQEERDALADRAEDLNRREADLKAARLRELEQWAAGARSTLENLVREIREGELTREKTQRVKEFIGELNDGLAEQRESARAPVEQGRRVQKSDEDLGPGVSVQIHRTGKRGVIQRKGKGETWIVQVGTVRLPVDEDQLEAVVTESPQPDTKVSVGAIQAKPSFELDIRGFRFEDAIDAVERQIDQAVLSGMGRFGVIHGMGEGILQKGVQDLLGSHGSVRKFAFARPEDGGFGKTIVDLK